jgi:hypothetical protein
MNQVTRILSAIEHGAFVVFVRIGQRHPPRPDSGADEEREKIPMHGCLLMGS